MQSIKMTIITGFVDVSRFMKLWLLATAIVLACFTAYDGCLPIATVRGWTITPIHYKHRVSSLQLQQQNRPPCLVPLQQRQHQQQHNIFDSSTFLRVVRIPTRNAAPSSRILSSSRNGMLRMKPTRNNNDDDDDENEEPVAPFHQDDDFGKFEKGIESLIHDSKGDFSDDDDDDNQILYGKFATSLNNNNHDHDLFDQDDEEDWESSKKYPLVSSTLSERLVQVDDQDDDDHDYDDESDDELPLLDGDHVEEKFGLDDDETISSSIGGGIDGTDDPWTSNVNKPSDYFVSDYSKNDWTRDFINNNSSSTSTPMIDLSSIEQRMADMQHQIDSLTALVTERINSDPSLLRTLPQSNNNLVTAEQQHSVDFLSSSPTKFIQPRQHQVVVAPPIKAMLFIDGTWLYYSIHEREQRGCPIIQKFGRGWQTRYQVDWAALPRLICQQLSSSPRYHLRSVEPVRVVVFTSFKANTPKTSYRYQMFQDMQQHVNLYDVHMMETVGRSEKCVDISLAVEMLHYATVGDAFDVAILLSGDKDFMPAMIRTRQKGRQVALASMRTGCNRELCTNPHVKDFTTIWIDDYLDEWIFPKSKSTTTRSSRSNTDLGLPPRRSLSSTSADMTANNNNNHKQHGGAFYDAPRIQNAAFKRIVIDFIAASGRQRVASRDIGRYLKMLVLPSSKTVSSSAEAASSSESASSLLSASSENRHRWTMLDCIKNKAGSLFHFFNQSDDTFFIEERAENEDELMFWVRLPMDPEKAKTMMMQQYEELSDIASHTERAFFDTYSLDLLEDNSAALFFHTYQADPVSPSQNVAPRIGRSGQLHDGHVDDDDNDDAQPPQVPDELTRDYTLCTLMELKERCRERKLPVSGTKAVLLERIRQDVEKGLARLEEEYSTANGNNRLPKASSAPVLGVSLERSVQPMLTSSPASSSRYLARLIQEYLQCRGGDSSSRQVGRYLASKPASSEFLSGRGTELSALQQLKEEYGSLRTFIILNSRVFVKGKDVTSGSGDFSFTIQLRQKVRQRSTESARDS